MMVVVQIWQSAVIRHSRRLDGVVRCLSFRGGSLLRRCISTTFVSCPRPPVPYHEDICHIVSASPSTDRT